MLSTCVALPKVSGSALKILSRPACCRRKPVPVRNHFWKCLVHLSVGRTTVSCASHAARLVFVFWPTENDDLAFYEQNKSHDLSVFLIYPALSRGMSSVLLLHYVNEKASFFVLRGTTADTHETTRETRETQQQESQTPTVSCVCACVCTLASCSAAGGAFEA